jgi:DNA-binding transcriptional MerR regulator
VSDKRLRPVDLAREHGPSTQAVRNFEDEGILPAAQRTPHGYRVYTPLHAQALRTFVALVPAHGHRTGEDIMRAVNAGDINTALTLLDESHAQLLQDRKTLAAVDIALRDPATGYRDYTSMDVRDAHLAHQLRRGGYLLYQIAPLIAQVRHAGGVAPLETTLDPRPFDAQGRSRAFHLGGGSRLPSVRIPVNVECRRPTGRVHLVARRERGAA